ncbi:MAG: hypothetical protein A7315_05760 [Candidatus Altiarchaeales archaeon WOR_SM1_79]|nr:MAG: hypothetical protein A7315_05760 [Candidatus Altiarchaeales archaeon WOR_SM1_79]
MKNKTNKTNKTEYMSHGLKNIFIYSLLILLFSNSVSAAQSIDWIEKTPMPINVGAFGYAVVDGNIYIIGGDSSGLSMNTVQRYNPATDTWEADTNHGGTLAPLPAPRAVLFCGVINGKIHAIGGWENGAYKGDHFIYDPDSNTWSTGPSIPQYPIGQFAASVNNKIYVFGGWWGNYRDHVFEYSEEGGWSSKSPMPTARNHGTTAVYNGKIYIIGGEKTQLLDVVEVYDPETNTWGATGLAPMPSPQHWLGSSGSPVFKGIIYVLGPGDTAYGYDPQADSWETLDLMPDPAYGIATINGVIYAIGADNTFHRKKPDGESCSNDSECLNNYCVHNVCRLTDPYCGDSYCDSGETYSPCPTDCGCNNGETQVCNATNGCQGSQTCTNGQWGACTSTLKQCSDGSCISQTETCPVCENGQTQMCSSTNGCDGSQTCTNGQWGACTTTLKKCLDDTCILQSEICPVCENGQTKSCVASNGCLGSQACVTERWSECTTTLQKCPDDACKEICPESEKPECTSGQTKCINITYFECHNGEWQNRGVVEGKCNYTLSDEPEPSSGVDVTMHVTFDKTKPKVDEAFEVRANFVNMDFKPRKAYITVYLPSGVDIMEGFGSVKSMGGGAVTYELNLGGGAGMKTHTLSLKANEEGKKDIRLYGIVIDENNRQHDIQQKSETVTVVGKDESGVEQEMPEIPMSWILVLAILVILIVVGIVVLTQKGIIHIKK